jgi:hypothetical protein
MTGNWTTVNVHWGDDTQGVAGSSPARPTLHGPHCTAHTARPTLHGPEEQAKLDDLASLLDEMLAETGGPLTASERKAADRALGR